MKSLSLPEIIGIALVVGSVTFLIISDLFGQSLAVSIFKWGWLAFAVSLVVNVVFSFYEGGEYKAKIRKRTLRKIDKKIRNLDYLTAENAVGFFALDARTGESKSEFQARSPRSITVNGTEPGRMERPPVPALEAIGDALCLALVAPQGSGKTTLLQHLIEHRQTQSLIIDPHGFPGKYGDRPIIGAGKDYPAVDQALDRLLNEVSRRYRDYHRTNYPLVDVFVDECTLLHKNTEHFEGFIEVALTEFRKVNLRLTICLHSRRARFLGLSGAMDLTDGVSWLSLKQEGAARWGELETVSGVVRLSLPGPFHGRGGESFQQAPGGPSPWTDPRPDDFAPDAEWTERPQGETATGGPGGLKRKVSGLLGYFQRPDLSEARAEIWEALYRNGRPLSPKALSELTGKRGGTVRKLLHSMEKAGEVERRGRGRYSVPGL